MKKKSTFPRTPPPPLPWQPDKQTKKDADYIQLVPSDRDHSAARNATSVTAAPKAYSDKGLPTSPSTFRPLPLLPEQPDKQPKKEVAYIQLVHSDREDVSSTSVTGATASQSKAFSDKELSKPSSRTPRLQKTDGASVTSPDSKSPPGKRRMAFPYVAYSTVYFFSN